LVDNDWSSFQQRSGKALSSMPAQQILQEASRLYKVSESLDMLAEQDVHLADALTVLSGTVRNSATFTGGPGYVAARTEQGLDSRSN